MPEKELANYNPNVPQAKRIDLVVPQSLAGLRLDQALQRLLPDYSRSRLQSWIRAGWVMHAGRPAAPRDKVWQGEQISVLPQLHPSELPHAPEAIALDIVYEDEALLVINKPAGLVVHPGSGNWQGTLLNALLHYAPQLAGVPRAGIVHRLDKDTSGLLVVAKTLVAQTDLVRQLQARTVQREYLAIVSGAVVRDGRVEAPLGRHPTQRTRMAVIGGGKPALTHYRVVQQLAGCTLIQCRLETGRTHQIRVHMQALGHPLLGDPVYGAGSGPLPAKHAQAVRTFGRQALHAARLGLIHPLTRTHMEWQAEMPEDMRRLLAALQEPA